MQCLLNIGTILKFDDIATLEPKPTDESSALEWFQLACLAIRSAHALKLRADFPAEYWDCKTHRELCEISKVRKIYFSIIIMKSKIIVLN